MSLFCMASSTDGGWKFNSSMDMTVPISSLSRGQENKQLLISHNSLEPVTWHVAATSRWDYDDDDEEDDDLSPPGKWIN